MNLSPTSQAIHDSKNVYVHSISGWTLRFGSDSCSLRSHPPLVYVCCWPSLPSLSFPSLSLPPDASGDGDTDGRERCGAAPLLLFLLLLRRRRLLLLPRGGRRAGGAGGAQRCPSLFPILRVVLSMPPPALSSKP
jgi:hypothetical protein